MAAYIELFIVKTDGQLLILFYPRQNLTPLFCIWIKTCLTPFHWLVSSLSNINTYSKYQDPQILRGNPIKDYSLVITRPKLINYIV